MSTDVDRVADQEQSAPIRAIAESRNAATVPAVFEKVVRKYGARTAVSSAGKTLSYTKLNELANRVAWTVLAAGEERDAPVALLVDGDLAAMAGLMGVLKAGAIYCFLPRGNPPAINAFILEDLGARLLLTDDANEQAAQALDADDVVVLNIEQLPVMKDGTNPPQRGDLGDVAAIYFTSGSTNKPKGVMRTHSTLLGRYEIDQGLHYVGPGDHIALLQGMHFTASCSNYFSALLGGATLHIADPAQMGAQALAEWLIENRITYLRLLMTVLRQVFETAADHVCFENLSYIRPSGRTYRSDIELMMRHLPQTCRIAHGLGMTEASLPVHMFVQRDALPEGDVIPLGTAVEGTDIMLLGEDGQPVPQGDVGLFVIASPTVSPGYWRRPDLTAEKFKENPTDPTRRTFYSGDLGRLRDDGLYEFVGRKDNQVKVRGFRIELEAVEKALEQLPGVFRAAAKTVADGRGEAILVCYVEPFDGASLSTVELRRRLAQDLPEYMVPSRLIALSKLPLGQTGKVNKAALPDPDLSRPALDVAYVGPRTATELLVASIWADVFGFDDIGINDSFFDLGGQSIMAVKIVGRIRDQLQTSIAVDRLFQAATIAELAQLIVDESGISGEAIDDDLDEILKSFGV